MGVTNGPEKKQGTSAGSAEPERRAQSDRIKTRELLRVVPAGGIGGAEKAGRRFRQNNKPFSSGFGFQ